jgi:hypothetical protein
MLLERFKKFLRRSGIFALTLLALHFAALFFFNSVYTFSFGFGLIVFMYVFFGLFHYALLRLASQRSTPLFVRVFMLLTLGKMLLLLLILAIYVIFNRQNAVPFMVVFSLSYVGFSALEVMHTYQYVKENSSS